MGKEELQELLTELEDICCELSATNPGDVYSQNSVLIRLSSCTGKLKTYHVCSEIADEVFSSIQDYVNAPNGRSFETIFDQTGELIDTLKIELEKDSVLDTLKKEYAETRDKVAETIPEEVKDTCKEVAKQAKELRKKAEKKAKSKIRSWLLSDDEE